MNLVRNILLFARVAGFWAAAGLAACSGGAGGDGAPAQPLVVPVIEGHAAAAPGDFDKVAFACCTDPVRTQTLAALAKVGSRLAADDLLGSQAAAAELVAVARVPAMAGAPDAATFEDIATRGARMAGASDLPAMRVELQPLTDAGVSLALASPGGADHFALAYCPMKPGSWLQSGEPLANPYYGAAMLRCGSFQAPAPKAP
jgi:hypothetical protein